MALATTEESRPQAVDENAKTVDGTAGTGEENATSDDEKPVIDDEKINIDKVTNTAGERTSTDNEKTHAIGEKDDNGSLTPTLQGDDVDASKPLPDAQTEEEEIIYLTGFKLAILIFAITLAGFLMLLDMSIIVTAIPRITTRFHSLPDVGWYGSAYNLSSAALQPLSGKLYTYFKSRWMFLMFLFLFEVGSLICGVATSSTMLILGRAVAGIGTSGIMNGALTIIAHAAPLEKRPSLMGMVMGGCQLGLVAGPLIGGAFTQYTTWRWCFYINLPIGGIAGLIILFIQIPDKSVRPEGSLFKTILHKLDLTGFVLFAPFAIMLLLALEYGGNQYPWRSATVIGLLCGAGVNLLIFLAWEYRAGEEAMIPLPVIGQREIWTSCLVQMFLMATVLVMSFYLPIYFQSSKGATPFESGVDLLPSILTQLFFAVTGGFLTQKVGYYLPFAVVSSIVVTIASGLFSTLDPDTHTAVWAGYQALVGFGRGVGMQIAILAVQANTKPALIPVATATLVFSQTLGGAIFLTIANAIFSNKLRDELKSLLPHLNTDNIIAAGATGIREVVSGEDVGLVARAYSKGVDGTFYFAAACTVCMFACSWGIGWVDIRKKKPVKAAGV